MRSPHRIATLLFAFLLYAALPALAAAARVCNCSTPGRRICDARICWTFG